MDIEQDAPSVAPGDVSAAPVSDAAKARKGRARPASQAEPERIDTLSRLDIVQAVTDAARSNETSELNDGFGRTWHVSPDTVDNRSVILLRAVKASAVAAHTVPTSAFAVSHQPAHDAIAAICAQLP